VKGEDDLGFLDRLELEAKHQGLNQNGRDDEEIVSRERGVPRIEKMRGDEERQHQRAEKAGPGLLNAEADELVRKVGGRSVGFRLFTEFGFPVDEARQRGPKPRGAAPAGPIRDLALHI